MKQIQIAYRKIITAQSKAAWDKFVFEDTYKEFLMQFQFYNAEGKYTSFSGLLAENPLAEKLHFLVSAATTGYIKQLQNKIPDVQNTLGKSFLPFHLYRFEIIDSNIQNKNEHCIAIIFYSEPVWWLDTVGDCLLISTNTGQDVSKAISTDTIKMQPFVSIHSVQYTQYEPTISSKNILS